MKKILIISAYLPYPLNSGGNVGPFEMINHFRNQYEISFLFPFHRNVSPAAYKELTQIWGNVTFYPFKKSFKQNINRLFFKVFYKIFQRFFTQSYFLSLDKHSKTKMILNELLDQTKQVSDNGFRNYVNAVISKQQFDLIQVEYYDVLSLSAFMNTNSPVIFVHHELRFVRYEREIATTFQSNTFLKALLEQNKAYEIELLKSYNKIIVMSNTDKNILSQYLPQELIYTSPSSIRSTLDTYTEEDFLFNNNLLFLGSGGHFPNKDALIWFLENCFCKLRIKNHLLRLKVIGIWDNEIIDQYSSEYVHFTGFVPDLRKAMRNCIMVVPLRIGSGIRMKILDSVLSGIPFITTSIGVEGLEFVPDKDCFIADGSEKFTEKTLELVSKPLIQKEFIRNARNTFEQHYSFEKAIEKREKLYQSILT